MKKLKINYEESEILLDTLYKDIKTNGIEPSKTDLVQRLITKLLGYMLWVEKKGQKRKCQNNLKNNKQQ